MPPTRGRPLKRSSSATSATRPRSVSLPRTIIGPRVIPRRYAPRAPVVVPTLPLAPSLPYRNSPFSLKMGFQLFIVSSMAFFLISPVFFLSSSPPIVPAKNFNRTECIHDGGLTALNSSVCSYPYDTFEVLQDAYKHKRINSSWSAPHCGGVGEEWKWKGVSNFKTSEKLIDRPTQACTLAALDPLTHLTYTFDVV